MHNTKKNNYFQLKKYVRLKFYNKIIMNTNQSCDQIEFVKISLNAVNK